MPLVVAGRNFIAGSIGDFGTLFDEANAHVGAGDSDAAFDETDTDLQGTNKARAEMASGYPQRSGNTLTFRSVFGPGEANFAWEEWGVFNAGSGGTMLNRKVQPMGTKTAAQSWQVTAQLLVSIFGAEAKNVLDLLTHARASAAYYYASDGTLTVAAIDEPRQDYDPATLVALGLLLEGARTNSLRNPRAEGATTGVIGSGGAFPTNWGSASVSGLTRTIVGVGSEDGIPYIDLQVSGTPSATGGIPFRHETTTQIVAAQNDVWAASSFVRLVGGSLTGLVNITLGIEERTDAGSFLTSGTSVITPTNDALRMQRRALVRTLTNASTARIDSLIGVNVTSGVAVDVTLRIGAPQLELGGYMTSVILPPASSPAATTRAADSALISDLGVLGFVHGRGSMFVEGRSAHGLASSQQLFSFDDTTADEVIRSQHALDGALEFEVIDGGVQQCLLTPDTFGGYTKFSLAVGWEANDFAAVVDNGDVVTDVDGSVPTPTRLVIGSGWDGWIEQMDYYPTRIPNE